MEQIKLKTKTQCLIECPFCGEYDHSVTHLMGSDVSFGPWYCDKCGKSIEGKINSGVCFIKKSSKVKTNTLVALELSDLSGPIFFIVKGMKFDREKGNDEYFYEEHNCPANFMGDIVELIYKNETDPHGVFNYLKTVPMPEENIDNYSVEDFQKLFNFPKTITG